MKVKQFILCIVGLGVSVASYGCGIDMNVRNVKQGFANNPTYKYLSISGPFLRTSKVYDSSVDKFSYHAEGSAFSCEGNYNLRYSDGLSNPFNLPNHKLQDGYIYYWDASSDNINGYKYIPMVPPTKKPLIIGYYTNYATYASNYQPADIPSQVDVVNYAFAQVGGCNTDASKGAVPTETNPLACAAEYNSGGEMLQPGIQDFKLHSTDPWADFYSYSIKDNFSGDDLSDTNIGGLGNIAKILITGKPTVLSIGGWSLEAPIREAIKPEHVTTFVQSIIDYMKKVEADSGQPNRFYGVDIDWEPNGNLWNRPATSPSFVALTNSDLTNYLNFITLLRSALNKESYKYLSVALPASYQTFDSVDSASSEYWNKLYQALNNGGEGTLDLMTYDINGQNWAGTCSYTQFNSPLYADKANPCYAADQDININSAVYELHSKFNIPAAGIVIGTPAYGRSYSLQDIHSITSTNPYGKFNPNVLINNIAVPDNLDVWSNRQILTGRAYGGVSQSENTVWTDQNYNSTITSQSIATGWVNYTTAGFISYISNANAKNLMSYAANNDVAGIMVWALDQDVQPGDTDPNGAALNWNNTSVINGLYMGRPGKLTK